LGNVKPKSELKAIKHEDAQVQLQLQKKEGNINICWPGLFLDIHNTFATAHNFFRAGEICNM